MVTVLGLVELREDEDVDGPMGGKGDDSEAAGVDGRLNGMGDEVGIEEEQVGDEVEGEIAGMGVKGRRAGDELAEREVGCEDEVGVRVPEVECEEAGVDVWKVKEWVTYT